LRVITTSTQNLRAKFVGLGMALAAILSSCEDPSSIGLELDPNNNQIGVSYIEIPLSADVVQRDSVYTTNTGVVLYGRSENDFFGVTEAIGYSRLFYNRDIARPKPGARLDSVKLNINFREVIAEELQTPKKLSIHLLQEQIRDKDYYTFDGLSHDPLPTFQATIDFRAKQDTIVTLPVENAFTDLVFEELVDGRYFGDIFAFREFLPGLVFKGENASFSTRIGNNTGLIFYYTNDGDTVSRAYPIATGLNFNLARHFTQTVIDRTGTPTEVVQEKNKAYNLGQFAGGKSTYGMVVKLNTSALDQFLDTLENVTFNQVILEMGPLVSDTSANYPPQFLKMYLTNETNQILFRKDGLPMLVQQDGVPQVDGITGEPAYSDRPAILTHLRDANIYTQFLTSHMNALYRKKIERRDFLLFPGAAQTDDFANSLREYQVDQSKIKFKIFYSKGRSL
jgi:Domain of unknown function (DUF4270)